MTLRLDGATGTELQRRGVPVRPPWWTNTALCTPTGLATLAAIHAEYVAAGAQVVTANTFRGNVRAWRGLGLTEQDAASLVQRAVGTARAVAGDRAVVAGSLAPAADCYHPELVPGPAALRAEHAWLARRLVESTVDLVLVETMNTVAEAGIAVAAVRAAGGRAWASFAVGPKARLLSGEPVADGVRTVEAAGAEAVLVNCSSLADTEVALRVVAAVATVPVGAYPNIEDRTGIPPATHVDRHVAPYVDPPRFAATLHDWVRRYGLGIVGGCCGTTPAHISLL